MDFDIGSAIAVRQNEDDLLEMDTGFDVSTAMPVIKPETTKAPAADKDTIQLKGPSKEELPKWLQSDWNLNTISKANVRNAVWGIATAGIVPMYNAITGIANAVKPNTNMAKMVFDSAIEGMQKPEVAENLGGAAQKAYPDAPWLVSGTMGAIAEMMIFMPGLFKAGAEAVSRDQLYMNSIKDLKARPQWGEFTEHLSKHSKVPVQEVDRLVTERLWQVRNNYPYWKLLNDNLKRVTGINILSETGSAQFVRPKVGQSVGFANAQGVVKTGVIKELAGERAIIDLEGKQIVATLNQLTIPEPQPTGGKPPELTPQQEGMKQSALDYAKAKDIEITPEGNLVLYHGTKEGRSPKEGNWKVGTYFTESKDIAERFAGAGEGGKVKIMRVEVPPEKVFSPSVTGTGEGYFTLNEEIPVSVSGQKPPVEPPKTAVDEPALTVPPIKPPDAGEPSNIPEPEPSPVEKIIQALKEAKPVKKEQAALYRAERGKRIAAARAMGQKVAGEAGFHAQLGALKGELPKPEFTSLRGKVEQADIDSLFGMVRDSALNDWEKITAQTGLAKLLGEMGGKIPTEGELKLLNAVFGPEMVDAILANRTTWQKIAYGAGQILNIPRSIMASFDLSAPLRQGIFMIGRQKQFVPAFQDMFGYFANEKNYNTLMETIRQNPNYDLMQEYNLALTDIEAGLTNREEKFMSSWAEKIPLIKHPIKASNRAYSGFLNKLRADVFSDLVDKADRLGLDPRGNPKMLEDLVSFINAATGRGSLGKIERAAVALNSVFFSPRLMASRINLMNPAFYIKKDPFVRQEALKSAATFWGAIATVLALAGMAGLTVGTDWRSSDFGKIKIGDTRIDIMGGFQQYFRMIGQLVTGEYVSSTTGKVMTLGEGYKGLTRWDILIRQLEAKESPVMSFVASMLKGKTFIGEDVNVAQEIGKRFVPMVIGDIVETAIKNPWMLPISALGVFGVGIQTYSARPSKGGISGRDLGNRRKLNTGGGLKRR